VSQSVRRRTESGFEGLRRERERSRHRAARRGVDVTNWTSGSSAAEFIAFEVDSCLCGGRAEKMAGGRPWGYECAK